MYAKASRYELDIISALEIRRDLLATGVIVVKRMDNLGLGLCLHTAAAKAEGCASESNNDLVALSLLTVQQDCTLIHKRVIYVWCATTTTGSWR